MKHCMIDLETLGSSPDGAIIAIGGALFDPTDDGVFDTFEHLVAVKSALQYGTLSPDTLLWWNSQEARVRNDMFSGTDSLITALLHFSDWYQSSKAKRIWANGTTFDITILEHGFAQTKVDRPYHHRDVRDCRWFRDVVPSSSLPEREGMHHSAVDDAVWQAKAVQACYRHLGLSGEVRTG